MRLSLAKTCHTMLAPTVKHFSTYLTGLCISSRFPRLQNCGYAGPWVTHFHTLERNEIRLLATAVSTSTWESGWSDHSGELARLILLKGEQKHTNITIKGRKSGFSGHFVALDGAKL